MPTDFVYRGTFDQETAALEQAGTIASENGINSILSADLPPEEASEVIKVAKNYGVKIGRAHV